MSTTPNCSTTPDSSSTQSFSSPAHPYRFAGRMFLVEAWTERYVLVYLPGSTVPAKTAARSPKALDAACAAILAELPQWGGDAPDSDAPEPPPPSTPATYVSTTERRQQQMVQATGLQNPRDAWAALMMERGILVRTIRRLNPGLAAPGGK